MHAPFEGCAWRCRGGARCPRCCRDATPMLAAGPVTGPSSIELAELAALRPRLSSAAADRGGVLYQGEAAAVLLQTWDLMWAAVGFDRATRNDLRDRLARLWCPARIDGGKP